jgi:hypothetical protein
VPSAVASAAPADPSIPVPAPQFDRGINAGGWQIPSQTGHVVGCCPGHTDCRLCPRPPVSSP